MHELLQQTPSTQNVDMHSLPAPHSSPFAFGPPGTGPHAPAPLQVMLPVHSPAGFVPCAYGWQTPSLFGWLHERQGPMQAFAQQTPSTQKLARHWALSVHGEPVARLHAPDASQSRASMPPPSPGAASPASLASLASPAPSVPPPSPPSSPPPSIVPGQPPCVSLATPGQSSIASGTPSRSPSAGTSDDSCRGNVPREPAGIDSVPPATRVDAASARTFTRSAPCVVPGWSSTVPRCVALSGLSAPLSGTRLFHSVPVSS